MNNWPWGTLRWHRLAAGCLLVFCAGQSQSADDALVAKGAYLARAADCVACHTATGGAAYAGGYPIDTLFGTFYGSNITPDKETGIGSWTDDEFVRAVREGVRPGGANLYPAMPYNSYAKLSRSDVLAIKAFLFSQAAVRRTPTPNDVLFPLQFRSVISGWKLFNPAPEPLAAMPAESEAWNRGRYLVEAAGHCGECHSPRTLLQGEDQQKYLAGGALGSWFAYNISPDQTSGIGSWSTDELVRFLQTGSTQRSVASGPMAEVVSNSTRFLTPADLSAMALYLKSVAPQAQGASRTTGFRQVSKTLGWRGSEPSTPTGAELFNGNCASCHGLVGQGQGDGVGAYPALQKKSSIGGTAPGNLIAVILDGVDRYTNDGHVFMPPFREELTDAELASLASYVRSTFGQDAADISPQTVGRVREPMKMHSLRMAEALIGGVLALFAVISVLLLMRAWRHKLSPERSNV